jgi:hypothetical protein
LILEQSTGDAPKSYVLIFAFLGNKCLAIYGCFLVLPLRVSTQKNTVGYVVYFARINSVWRAGTKGGLPILDATVYHKVCM